jgi:hypothetical protein
VVSTKLDETERMKNDNGLLNAYEAYLFLWRLKLPVKMWRFKQDAREGRGIVPLRANGNPEAKMFFSKSDLKKYAETFFKQKPVKRKIKKKKKR